MRSEPPYVAHRREGRKRNAHLIQQGECSPDSAPRDLTSDPDLSAAGGVWATNSLVAPETSKSPQEKYPDPKTVKEALSRPDGHLWRAAIYAEILKVLKRGTLRFVDRSEARRGRLMTAKWVLKKKLDQDNNLDKYKDRMVARGFI